MVILVHMASVWVPFISEGKEAIADYDEIRKEVKLAIAECGRRLAAMLRRKRTRADYSRRRDVFTRYIDEVVESVGVLAPVNKEEFRKVLVDLARTHTAQADMEFDEHGKVVKRDSACRRAAGLTDRPAGGLRGPGNDMGLADTIVVDRSAGAPPPTTLFDAKPPRHPQTPKMTLQSPLGRLRYEHYPNKETVHGS